MQATHPIRTIPRRALALALILIAVLVLAGLSGYLAFSRRSATSTTSTTPHVSDTSAPAMLEQFPRSQAQDRVPSNTSAPGMIEQTQPYVEPDAADRSEPMVQATLATDTNPDSNLPICKRHGGPAC